MLNKNQLIKQFIALSVVFSFFLLPFSVLAANFSGDHKWAWSENTGWLNFQPTHEGVTVADDGLTGYLWAENVGWIKLDYDGVAGSNNNAADDWGVTNDGDGNLAGYAWGENIGWVNFNPTDSQVTIDSNGDFSGYAWGENVGWIKFDHTQTSYTPQTTWSSAPANSAPTINSVDDYPDPLEAGETITFSVDWSDDDGDGVKIYICKAEDGTTSGCGEGGTWCSYTDSYSTTNPISCTYSTGSGDIGSNDYYAYVCDDEPSCSDATSGTFTVEEEISSPIKIEKGVRFKKGVIFK